ncbi:ISL3 family transposase [Streptomyces sp. 11x1]|uniref:ISL3 family transposase n=1 Tax=Streptomyces sp. 11x1 TaxID=3038642 RepID=UPI002931BD0F|nr:ISL3 family transposase [Streptomyces sp. 11x1]WNZ10294.1 ISL3 family transposase [Streptomyces sp. 11x1]WNZ11624.1 ISL3 family transposase [Streptomyces sp. 11x1]WNZ13479.1 ISL3 family transposase [Streptomyces sp. 11x1]WNZ13481.1 ISL3 family transposase [Streptomyces sp. 11x1]WNZ13549.1 ISL3 family transposase [Streptomyces sp. 11x1]
MGDVFLQGLWFHKAEGVVIEKAVVDGELVLVRARASAEQAACHACGTTSGRVHSRYVRRLTDTAVAGRPVVIELQVRRFRCRERACTQATFAEQVEGLTFRYGRRSTGLQTVLQRVAVMLAGRAGARLADTLAVRASRSTLLRLIRRLPEPEVHTPRVLGVDEFALRKGHNYGTILVDIDTRRPVDLLPDRTTATVSAWLADHPGVEVICRDRSTAYAEAGRLGAPDAVHVADRWHIWKNLVEAVEKTVIQHRALLREPEETSPVRTNTPVNTTGFPPRPSGEPRHSGRLSDRVREQHTAVHALLDDGLGLRPIARRLGLARNTVRRLARAATADELLVGQWTGRSSILDPYKPYLHQRWAEGCTVARRLFEELRERGYPGGESVVKRYVQQLREAFPHDDPPRKHPSVRDVTSWITRRPDRLDSDQVQRLKAILARCPELGRTAEHVRSFAELMNNRQGKQLDQWIECVQADDLPALHAFVTGLGQDLDAVVAGLSLPYSSGAVEGHNNKIKMLKRQMFGRANFDLLRKRVLLAA